MLEKLAYLEQEFEHKGIPVYTYPISEMRHMALEGADERLLQLLAEKARQTDATAAVTDSLKQRARLYRRFLEKIVELELLMHDPHPLLPLKQRVMTKVHECMIGDLIRQAEKAEFAGQREKAIVLYKEAAYELRHNPVLDAEILRRVEARIAALREGGA